MGSRGPAPKDPSTVQRTNSPGAVELAAGDPSLAPPIPEGDWLAETVEWWVTWCASAQATQFTGPAWQRLKMLVPVVDRFFRTCILDDLKEIRMQEKMLGAMPEDMQRLRWRRAPSESSQAPGKARKSSARRKTDPRKAHLKSVV